MAEWSKALASGASPQGRGLEPHSCHLRCFAAHDKRFCTRLPSRQTFLHEITPMTSIAAFHDRSACKTAAMCSRQPTLLMFACKWSSPPRKFHRNWQTTDRKGAQSGGPAETQRGGFKSLQNRHEHNPGKHLKQHAKEVTSGVKRIV